MNTSAVIMLLFASLLLYGGLGICLRIALRAGGRGQQDSAQEASESTD